MLVALLVKVAFDKRQRGVEKDMETRKLTEDWGEIRKVGDKT